MRKERRRQYPAVLTEEAWSIKGVANGKIRDSPRRRDPS